jgi:hypothetical protein
MKTATLNIRIEAPVKAKLQELADADNRKLGDYVSLLLKKFTEKKD